MSSFQSPEAPRFASLGIHGGRDSVLDTGKPACFASRTTRWYRGKNTQKKRISLALPSLQPGCSLSWALPRRPINTGKEKRSQIVPWTDCRTLSPGTPASWETRLVYGCGWEEGTDDRSAFSRNQIWQFPTQGSRELTYAEYQVLQVESDLWVRSAATMAEANQFSVVVDQPGTSSSLST